jgi:hypothetical protein
LLDGELKGNAPLLLKLLMGQYTVEARKDGFLDVQENVKLQENEARRLVLHMLPYEGSRQATADKWGRVKWITGITGLLAGGAAVYFNSVANSKYDNYRAATTSDAAASYRDKTKSNDLYCKIALGTAGTFLTTAIISWIVQAAH